MKIKNSISILNISMNMRRTRYFLLNVLFLFSTCKKDEVDQANSLVFNNENDVITGINKGFSNQGSYDNGLLCLSEGPTDFYTNYLVYYYNVSGTSINLINKVDFGPISNKSPFLIYSQRNLLVTTKDEHPASFEYVNNQFIKLQDVGLECHQVTNDPYKCSSVGTSYVINGDLLFVGNAFASIDNNLPESGTVSIFERRNKFWRKIGYLTASDMNTRDYFGISISVNGEYLLVGAPGNDDNGEDRGAIYLFKKQVNNTWVEIKKINCSISQGGIKFGHFVKLTDSYIISSAPDYNVNKGAVIIFNRIDYTEEKILKLNNSFNFGDIISFHNGKLFVVSQLDLFNTNYGVFVYDSKSNFELIKKFKPSTMSVSELFTGVIHTPELFLLNVEGISIGKSLIFHYK